MANKGDLWIHTPVVDAGSVQRGMTMQCLQWKALVSLVVPSLGEGE